MLGLLIVGGTVAFVAVLVWYCLKLNAERREGLAAVGKQLGLAFFPQGNEGLTAAWSHLDFLSHGDYRKVTNLLHGQVNYRGNTGGNTGGNTVTVAIFDYQYSMGRDKSTNRSPSNYSNTFVQSVLLFYNPALNLPSFILRKEQWHHKLADWAGNVDINFPDFPGFSKRYRLFGEQPQAIEALFQSNVLKFYERESLCTDAAGPYVLLFPGEGDAHNSNRTHLSGGRTFTESRYLDVEEIKPYLDKGLRLLSLFEHNL
jgi:hypothetical protein